jgi:hypothetical protein
MSESDIDTALIGEFEKIVAGMHAKYSSQLDAHCKAVETQITKQFGVRVPSFIGSPATAPLLGGDNRFKDWWARAARIEVLIRLQLQRIPDRAEGQPATEYWRHHPCRRHYWPATAIVAELMPVNPMTLVAVIRAATKILFSLRGVTH